VAPEAVAAPVRWLSRLLRLNKAAAVTAEKLDPFGLLEGAPAWVLDLHRQAEERARAVQVRFPTVAELAALEEERAVVPRTESPFVDAERWDAEEARARWERQQAEYAAGPLTDAELVELRALEAAEAAGELGYDGHLRLAALVVRQGEEARHVRVAAELERADGWTALARWERRNRARAARQAWRTRAEDTRRAASRRPVRRHDGRRGSRRASVRSSPRRARAPGRSSDGEPSPAERVGARRTSSARAAA
jgi:hypothetical protein